MLEVHVLSFQMARNTCREMNNQEKGMTLQEKKSAAKAFTHAHRFARFCRGNAVVGIGRCKNRHEAPLNGQRDDGAQRLPLIQLLPVPAMQIRSR